MGKVTSMADWKKKKEISDYVHELIAENHKLKGQDFEARIRGFEKYNDPDNKYQEAIQSHAYDVVHGEDGPYQKAKKKFDDLDMDLGDKVSEDHINEIIDEYVDAFLRRVHSETFDKIVDKAKNDGVSEKDIRDLKWKLFESYHPNRDNYSLKAIRDAYKNKEKLEVSTMVQHLAQKSIEYLPLHYMGKATEGLIQNEDLYDIHMHTDGKFKDAGLIPDDHDLTKDAIQIARSYGTFLHGGNMAKQGYQRKEVTDLKHPTDKSKDYRHDLDKAA